MRKTQLKKAKSARTRRIVKRHEPKVVEDVKQALFICGHQFSSIGKGVLRDLQQLKHMESLLMTRKHVGMAPFEEGGEVLLEKLSHQYDCGLFTVANHTKSKPHNLVMGRFYDHRIYDMIELGIDLWEPIRSYPARKSCPPGLKPCFVFLGEAFVKDEKWKLLKSIFLDFFRGREVIGVRFEGLQRLMVIAAVDTDHLLFRQYLISPGKHAAGNTGVEDFVEMGPRLDFTIRRWRKPPMELSKAALQKPVVKKKEKNVRLDATLNKVGSLYVPDQSIDSIVTARHKGFKRQRRETAERTSKRNKTSSISDANSL